MMPGDKNEGDDAEGTDEEAERVMRLRSSRKYGSKK